MVTVAIYNLSVRALEQNLELLLCQARLGGGGKGGWAPGDRQGQQEQSRLGTVAICHPAWVYSDISAAWWPSWNFLPEHPSLAGWHMCAQLLTPEPAWHTVEILNKCFLNEWMNILGSSGSSFP